MKSSTQKYEIFETLSQVMLLLSLESCSIFFYYSERNKCPIRDHCKDWFSCQCSDLLFYHFPPSTCSILAIKTTLLFYRYVNRLLQQSHCMDVISLGITLVLPFTNIVSPQFSPFLPSRFYFMLFYQMSSPDEAFQN